MAPSSSSPHLSPARSSCQISGGLIPAPRHAPAFRIRSWRRFAASSSEVSLVPARILRPPPRRRNALREKASQPQPPLVVWHKVRPPCHESPESGSLDSQEPKSGSFDAEPSSDLDQELQISGGQGASRSGDVAPGSRLDELHVIGDAEEALLCGTRADPSFSVYKYPEGNVTQLEVDEDEIISRREATEEEGSGYLESISSCARAMAMELQSSERVAQNSKDNHSRFHFAAAEKMESSVLNGEVSVVRRNVPPWRSVTWSGFAVLCGVCIVFIASKVSRSSSKARLPWKLFDVHRPEMKEDEFDKGILNVFRNYQEFPDGLLRRPRLNRKELMNNIKKAQDSRKWFVLGNSFHYKDVATNDDTNIPEIRRNAAEVHTPEERILEKYSTEGKTGIVIRQPIDGSSLSDLDEVSESSETNGISLSNDKIEESMEKTVDLKNGAQIMIGESMEQTVDLKNGAQIMNMSEKDKGNTGEIEPPEPPYSDGRATYINDRNSVTCTSEKEAQIGSAIVHKLCPNSPSTPPSEFESKEQCTEISEKNMDCIRVIEPSVPFNSENEMIRAKDNAYLFSTNVVSEPCDGFSISSSELTNNETPLDNVSDINGIQKIEVPRTSANIAHMACYEEVSHDTSILGTEACKIPVMAETMTAASHQRSREDSADLRSGSMQSMQELEPCISCGNGKQLSHGTDNKHKGRAVHNKTHARTETNHTRILNDAGTLSFCTSQEETNEHTFAEVSKSEKKQERKKPRAHLRKKKGRLQKEVCSDKEAATERSEEGKPGTGTVVDPTNCVQKTKRVPKKRQKKVQNETQSVPVQDDVQCSSMVDQENNSQHVKKERRKNPKNVFRNQGTQTREQNQETAYVINSPDNATTVANSSVETHFDRSSSSIMRKEESESPGKG